MIRRVLHNSVNTVNVIHIKANWGGGAVYSVYVSNNISIKNKCANITNMKTNQENTFLVHSDILLNSANLNTVTGKSHFTICTNHPSLVPNNDKGMDRKIEFTS
jgi:hypothetical protein